MLRAPISVRAISSRVLLLVAMLSMAAAAGGLEEGQAALDAGRFEAAAEFFTRAWAGTPEGERRGPALGLAAAVTRGRLEPRFNAADLALGAVVERGDADLVVHLALGELRLVAASTRIAPAARSEALGTAVEAFEQAVKAFPGEPAGVLGLARAWAARGRIDRAMTTLAPLLASAPSAEVLRCKGRLLYECAHAENEQNPGSVRARENVIEARGALRKATAADPASFEGWLYLGRSAQQLADASAAAEAYAKAMALDAESPAPLDALEALFGDDPEAFLVRLDRLAAEIPTNVSVHLARGRVHVQAARWEAAETALATFLERSTSAHRRTRAYTPLGQALTGLGREVEALRCFEQGLDAEPGDLVAANGLDLKLQRTYASAAASDLKAALRCADDYERLVKRTRENLFVLNNAGFLLREAYAQHQTDDAWIPILRSAMSFYARAAQVVADKPPEALAEAPRHERYLWAQITNDTGHMFQAFVLTRDLAKAEAHFLRALVLSENGSYDAWINLDALYQADRAYRKAYDLAERVAASLRLEDGTPYADGRAAALAVRKRLLDEGKVTEQD